LAKVINNPRSHEYSLFIAARNTQGEYSDHIQVDIEHPGIAKLNSPDITEFFQALRIYLPDVKTIESSQKVYPTEEGIFEKDILAYRIYITEVDSENNEIGETEEFEIEAKLDPQSGLYEIKKQFLYDAEEDTRYKIQVGAYDSVYHPVYNETLYEQTISDPVYASTRQIDGITQYASRLRPAIIVEELPDLSDPILEKEYPEESFVVKMETSNEEITSTELYQRQNDSWVLLEEPNFEDGLAVFPRVIAGTIQAGAISTDELAANAITSDKIATGEVTADKIESIDANISTITAGEGSVTIDENGIDIFDGKLEVRDEEGNSTISGGKISTGTIEADMYKEIRNVDTTNLLDSLDENNPIEFDFYIPSETENIISIKLSAKGINFRAYSQSASGGSHDHTVTLSNHTHSVDIPSHSHDLEWIETDTSSATAPHVHSYEEATSTDTEDSHTHYFSDSHDHNISVDSHDHSISTGMVNSSTDTEEGHNHGYDYEYTGISTGNTSPGGVTFSETVSGSTGSGGSHSHLINTSSENTSQAQASHQHPYEFTTGMRDDGDTVVTSGNGGATTETSSAEPHTHDIDYGIYEDTDPQDVEIEFDDGQGFGNSTSLGNPDSNQILADELDITEYFSGTGWKGIKFTSSRKGRISAHLIIKTDITA